MATDTKFFMEEWFSSDVGILWSHAFPCGARIARAEDAVQRTDHQGVVIARAPWPGRVSTCHALPATPSR